MDNIQNKIDAIMLCRNLLADNDKIESVKMMKDKIDTIDKNLDDILDQLSTYNIDETKTKMYINQQKIDNQIKRDVLPYYFISYQINNQ